MGAAPDTQKAQPEECAAFHGGGSLSGVESLLPPPPMKVRWTWRGKLAGKIENAAAIVGSDVFVADQRGNLTALDLAHGQPRWTYTSQAAFEASPLILDGKVLLGDTDGTFHALSVATGKKIWTFAAESGIHASANTCLGLVLFGDDGGGIFALDAQTGQKKWTAQALDRINSAPAIIGGDSPIAIFGGCDGHLRGLGVKDGHEIFDTFVETLCPGSPAAVADRFVVGTDRGRLLCYDLEGKKRLWEFTGAGPDDMVYSSPAISESLAVVGGRDQAVHGVDLTTGQQKWSFPTHGDVDSSPVISGSRVYVGSRDKQLYVLDLKTGKEIWSFTAGRDVASTPAIAQGVLVFGDTHGTLYCLEEGDTAPATRPAGR